VLTVEYSVHGAMYAVYGLLGVGQEIPRSTTGSSTRKWA
jgi:myosin-crossreactive antigen